MPILAEQCKRGEGLQEQEGAGRSREDSGNHEKPRWGERKRFFHKKVLLRLAREFAGRYGELQSTPMEVYSGRESSTL